MVPYFEMQNDLKNTEPTSKEDHKVAVEGLIHSRDALPSHFNATHFSEDRDTCVRTRPAKNEAVDIGASPEGSSMNEAREKRAFLETLTSQRSDEADASPIRQACHFMVPSSVIKLIEKGDTVRRDTIEYIQAQLNLSTDLNQMRSWLVLLYSMEMDYQILKATGIGRTVGKISKDSQFALLGPLCQVILMYWIGLLPKCALLNVVSETDGSKRHD